MDLLREIVRDAELGWEGHVLAGNVEHAEREGDSEKVEKAARLYALWEAIEKEKRTAMEVDESQFGRGAPAASQRSVALAASKD